jgi:hypothetical protein
MALMQTAGGFDDDLALERGPAPGWAWLLQQKC